MKYDKEESNILEAYRSGKMKLSTPSKKEIKDIMLNLYIGGAIWLRLILN